MSETVLNIFPPRGLDQSILVSVLFGIYILLFFTETLGWVWAGLVVPGYLASVFVIQPSSGMAICIEATATFVVCRAISDFLSRSGGWSPFFGRERFFLIVLVSVFVRQASELYLLSAGARWLDDVFGLQLGQQQLSSIGLVLVPLLANMAWKLSLPRAVFQIGVTVVMTWALVVFVLLRYTNLSYASLELTYEDVALDFLGSPKAYVILLSSAFLAARLNLSYGWDYNGILVPSLLALTWFDPRLTVSTIVEAAVLVVATKAALASPLLRRRNLEGPRKLALVFTLGFLLKWIGGWVLAAWLPQLRQTDLFGFGYVLTSLIAVKMINLKKTGRVLLPSLAVSFVGFVVGSGIGFGLEQLAPRFAADAVEPVRVAPTQTLLRSPDGVALLASARARRLPAHAEAMPISAGILREYGAWWRGVDRWTTAGGEPPLDLALRARGLGIQLVAVETKRRRCWAAVEAEEDLSRQRGWDSALICPLATGPVIEVVRPRSERPSALLAVDVCPRLDCRVVLFAGVEPAGRDGAVFAATRAAHAALEHQPIVEIRLDPQTAPTLYVRHVLPAAVRVADLWRGPVEVVWETPGNANDLWRAVSPRVVLALQPDAVWAALSESAPPLAVERGMSVFGWIDRWMANRVAPAHPSQTELLVLDEQLLSPLLERRVERTALLGTIAAALGHELIHLPDGAGLGREAWTLAGNGNSGWAAVAISGQPASSVIFEVPRPRSEAGTARLAAAAFQSLAANALLVDPEWAGAAPTSEAQSSARETATALHAVHQAATRSLAAGGEGAIVEFRGYALWRPLADAVVALGTPLLPGGQVPPAVAGLFEPNGLLHNIGGTPQWIDGSAELIPLRGGGRPQTAYAQVLGVPFASVWLSPAIRLRGVPQASVDELRDRATRLGLAILEKPIATALVSGLAPPTNAPLASPPLASAVALAKRYAVTNDLALLALLKAQAGVSLQMGWSPDLRVGYLLLEHRRARSVARAIVILGASAGVGPACATLTPGAGADLDVWRALGRWCQHLETSGVSTEPSK